MAHASIQVTIPSLPAASANAVSPDTSAPSTSTAPQPPPPKRKYDVYHWKNKSPNGRIIYITDTETADVELSRLPPGPLGFDIEWKPSFLKGQKPNPVALVQLGSEDTILLIQVSAMRAFPHKLHEVLHSTDFVKIGVGIQGDCTKLYNDHAVHTRNCVDLALLARSVDNPRWKGSYTQPIGLSRLCEMYEELTLVKGRAQTSNWEAQLSPQQLDYAANDCHIAFVLYRRFLSMAITMPSPPLEACYTFNVINGRPSHPTTNLKWSPRNPDYDPGPPPPRKPKVEMNTQQGDAVPLEASFRRTPGEPVIVATADGPMVSRCPKRRRQGPRLSADAPPFVPHAQVRSAAQMHSSTTAWPTPAEQRRETPLQRRDDDERRTKTRRSGRHPYHSPYDAF